MPLARPYPPQNLLHKVFDYNSETGIFIWRHREVRDFPGMSIRSLKFVNSRHAGTQAGCQSKTRGYRAIKISCFAPGDFKAHRLAWIYVYGSIDRNLQIDHINQDPTDNRIGNLRLVTISINRHNAALQINSTSGYPGVSWKSSQNCWHVRITVRGIRHHLGNSKSLAEAIQIRKAAEARFQSDIQMPEA